jgi:hypothetical protein
MTARQTIAFLCLVALLPSCTHWVEVPGPPGPEEEKVRVTTTAGEQVILVEHEMDDSEFGGWMEGYEAYWTSPLDSVSTFAVSRHSGTRSALLVVGTAVVTYFVVMAYLFSNSFDSFDSSYE